MLTKTLGCSKFEHGNRDAREVTINICVLCFLLGCKRCGEASNPRSIKSTRKINTSLCTYTRIPDLAFSYDRKYSFRR